MDATTETAQVAEPFVPVQPRIRFGAIVWGLLASGVAWLALSTVSSPSARSDFTEWLWGLNPGTITVIVILAVGGFILLQGALGLIRKAQRRAGRRYLR